MKAFRFRLERVLAWRGTELTLAEAKAEQLTSALRSTNEDMANVLARRVEAQTTVVRAATPSGAELGALEASRLWAVREEKRLAARIHRLVDSIEAQNHRVTQARRAMKLIERLKERQHVEWKSEADHELEALSGDAAIAQWRRLHATVEPTTDQGPKGADSAIGEPPR